ncbi:hypothetical protein DYB28_006746 [Aphanomyces astaci]|uniref:acetyl-CoA C-acyltransferase n=2 Tax=Aphanomyces astaci TaxID=112090 RepID=A0A9X8E3S7_APHAT|nr:hypothetical protein DYB28_006746 [Aphanomyces astaci]
MDDIEQTLDTYMQVELGHARQCSSGLQAFANVASAIQAGFYDVGIAAGVECMSLTDMGGTAPDVCWEQVHANKAARNCTVPMGITSENVAEKYGITRTQQDTFAAASHAKAHAAQEHGWFSPEITPVTTTRTTADGVDQQVTVTADEGVRPGTTVDGLAKLKASFKPSGTTTAGISSKQARPAVAIPAALKKAGLTIDQIDVFELNEAFASQALYSQQTLQIPSHKINPTGGAIALGHPLGCTGARQIATLLHGLHRTNQTYGVVSMCIGTGMGAAAVFKRD